MPGFLDSLSPLFNPQAAAGALQGVPQPTPVVQQNTVPTDAQIAMLREYVKHLQRQNAEPVGTVGGTGQAVAANAAKALTSGISGYFAGEANRAERAKDLSIADELGRDPFAPSASTTPAPAISAAGGSSSTDPVSRTIAIESGGDPSATTGSYRGLGQFSRSEEKRYRITDANWQNPDVQRKAIAEKQANDSKALAQHLGRTPSDAETYLAHQQGVGGAVAHLTNPNLPAWRNMRNTAEGQQKGEGWAKQAIWGNMTPAMKAEFPGGVDTVRSGDFASLWSQRYGGGSAAPSGKLAFNGASPPSSPTAGPIVNALNNPNGVPPVAPQQYAQALGGQQQPAAGTSVNYPQMVRDQTARLIRAGMKPADAATMATSMVEGNIKYQAQYTQPDEYGNVQKIVPGQPPEVYKKGQPILETYEPIKNVKQYRLKYRDPITGITTMQPADASGSPTGPATALGQGAGPPPAVAQAPLGAPPGATAAPPAPPAAVGNLPTPSAPAWPQGKPTDMAGAVAPHNAVVTPPASVAPTPRGGSSAVAAPATPPGAGPAAPPPDFMKALRTPPPTAALPPAATPTPPAPAVAAKPPLSPTTGHSMPQGVDATPEKLLEWQRGETAATKRAESIATHLGTALAKPVEAVIQRGDVASKEVRMLDTMEVLHKLTPQALSGPYSGTFLTLAKGLNELTGIDLGTSAAEGIDKLSTGLTTLAVREITNRPALAEFKTVMAANPNLSNTVKGRALLIDLLRQGAREDVALSSRASKADVIEHPEMWTDIADQYRADHPVTIHFDGKEYSTDPKSMAELDARLKAEGGAAAGPAGASAPVKVNSREEALKLPKGTRIILPDGSPGRVP